MIISFDLSLHKLHGHIRPYSLSDIKATIYVFRDSNTVHAGRLF